MNISFYNEKRYETAYADMATFVCFWFISWFYNVPTTCKVYFRDGSALAILCAATPSLRCELQIKHARSSSNGILNPGLLVFTLTLQRRAPGRATTRGMLLYNLLKGRWGLLFYNFLKGIWSLLL